MNYWAAVVDDDVLNQKAAEKILGLHGYSVSCLASGEALSSRRSYHDVYSQHYIINEIETCKATQFDPGFADIMLQMIAEDKEYTLREHSGQTKQDSPQPAEKGFISIFKLLEASGICVQNGM